MKASLIRKEWINGDVPKDILYIKNSYGDFIVFDTQDEDIVLSYVESQYKGHSLYKNGELIDRHV